MNADTLQLAHFEPGSKSNGPGLRAVFWFQGCTLNCPGCFNPQTHPVQGGQTVNFDQIKSWLDMLSPEIEGITLSGGEPFLQAPAVFKLLDLAKAHRLSSIVFTGFRWEELERIANFSQIIRLADVIISGRYQQNLRLAQGLLGSSNKKFHFLTNRYTFQDFLAIPQAEVLLTPDGQILFSGIDPLIWSNDANK
jgi:anaerobic ribonucleoside-triphosphate reductase activating protein